MAENSGGLLVCSKLVRAYNSRVMDCVCSDVSTATTRSALDMQALLGIIGNRSILTSDASTLLRYIDACGLLGAGNRGAHKAVSSA